MEAEASESMNGLQILLILSAVAGFFGAALFYSYYTDINVHSHYWCVVCTHFTAVGSKKLLFARFVFFGGLLNSVLFFAVFGILRGIFRAAVKRFAQNHS